MSSVCVFGGNGMLGSQLLPTLRLAGYNALCLVRTKNCDSDIQIDYTNFESLSRILDSIKPTHIVNLAAMTNVDECESSPNQAYEANVKVVELICEWIKKNGRCHLIQVSTDQVYDGTGPHPESRVQLLNYYSFSKYTGELVASSVPSTIIRTNFFGKSKSPSRKSFSDWAYQTLIRDERFSVFDDVFFSPLSIESLCEFIVHVTDQPISGIFNLGSEHGFSKADFVFEFARALNLPTKNISITSCRSMNLAAKRPTDMRMDCTKVKLAYGHIKLPSLLKEITKVAEEYEH